MSARVWIWLALSAGASAVLATLMLRPDALEAAPVKRTIFLPGATTDGHYQIELDCNACHGESFSNVEGMQNACERCHSAELASVDDSHPRKKFTDPRNADRVASLDARWCVTCHQEHRPERTSTMGLSLPVDYCYRCHETVGEERPTHAGLPFGSCGNAGCHNFHDNRALYEDFLVEHREEPWLRTAATVPPREPARSERSPLAADDHDAPGGTPELARWVTEWAGTGHARGGVNCSDCHAPKGSAWQDQPSRDACAACHENENEAFGASRHGMRLAAGLSPMTPSLARIPVHSEAHDRSLGCNTCHPAHAYDTRRAAAEACRECHADDHTLAWKDSSHARTWSAELAGDAAPGTGVSCATCHLPRRERGGRTVVWHNPNDTLRPNDKMIRSSCLHCHGLGFAIDSLADRRVVDRNFQGRARATVDSIHFATVLRWELEERTPPWETNRETEEREEKER